MDIVIVGGGIIGTATAARLGRTDHDVTLLERGQIGTETTAASAGMIMRAAVEPTPFDARLRNRAWSVYQGLFERTALDGERIGTLYLAETGAYADRLERSAATLQDQGVDASFRPPAELAQFGIDPNGFDGGPDEFTGGLHTPEDTRCNPAAVAAWFADCARSAGVDVRTGVEVTGIQTDSATRTDSDAGTGAVSAVETDAGIVEADTVVNAAGPWAPQLNAMVDISLPLAHTVGPMAELEGTESVTAPFTVLESKQYVRPGPADGASSAGSQTASSTDARAVVGEFETGYVDGQRFDPVERQVPDAFRAAAPDVASLVPELENATLTDEWVGYRTVTPDGRPIVGETAVSGYVVACGLTGLGITLAPAVADVVAELLAGARTGPGTGTGGTEPGARDDEFSRELSPARF